MKTIEKTIAPTTAPTNVGELLSELRGQGVKLWVEGVSAGSPTENRAASPTENRLRYSAPKGALTEAMRNKLRERKAEIVQYLNGVKQASDSTQTTFQPIPRIPRDGNLPLSFAQQRLWFLDQLEGDNAAYNLPIALCLTGRLDISALEQSLNEIVRRHETMRTTFKMVDGSPCQEIVPELTVTLPIIDLQHLAEKAEQADEVHQWAKEENLKPFDLTKAPLWRVLLLKLELEEHILIGTMHHIVFDGWSIGIFIGELAALYEAFAKGEVSPLPELPVQYVDFASWQRQWLQGEVLETQLSYWKQQLAGAPPVHELPLDRPRPPIQTFSGGTEYFQLDAELTRGLKTLSKRSKTTLFMTLLAAFVTLLCRYSGREDILVGSPIANRKRSEIELPIGFFVNTLVLRADLTGNPNFQELLARMRQVALDAYANQEAPFDRLVEVLQPERNLSHSPLCQVMFTLRNAPMPTQALSDLSFTPLEFETGMVRFDLELYLWEGSEELNGYFEYNRDLFDVGTIRQMVGHLQTLLEGIVANPEQRISELPLLKEAELHQLLIEWNDTEREYAGDKCIHQLFEEQVEQTPDAVAVVFEEEQLTYRELNAKANQLARYLQGLGVGPEVLVGICLERSLEMVVGLLGILKAGGAYVPLDSAYPASRIADILEDTGLSVLLTTEKVVERLPQKKVRAICLDTAWEEISKESQGNQPSGTAHNLAYVIYTSGSTGKPKGVAIEHSSVLNLAQGMESAIAASGSAPRCKVSLNGPLFFDTSVKQVVQLLYGRTLYIVPETIRFDSRRLLSYLQDCQIDVFDCTPSQLRLLVANGLISSDTAPKYVLVGGEPIDEPTWTALRQAKNRHFYNVYGPTECTGDATVCALGKTGDIPKIGRPIANTQIYILDNQLQPVPIGVTGELHIGGAGLARGYLNRPELTEQKFIPNPFSNEPDSRLYKTGDLARYLSDGNIELIGRIDNQVKVRGFRIELGEVESIVAQYPAVQQTVVTVREDVPGDKRLVAYVVPHRETPLTIDELRRFLKQKLPDYMVPSAFVVLEALPLTPNGKVNRRALHEPKYEPKQPQHLEATFVAPRNADEQKIAEIWAKVLKLERVGVRDNFFDLGGHSLLANQVISRLRNAFLVELPLVALFESPTVAELAERIEMLLWAAKGVRASGANTSKNYVEGKL